MFTDESNKESGNDTVHISSDGIEQSVDAQIADLTTDTLQEQLEKEKQSVLDCQDKLKHVMADFQNMSRKTQSDIENGINLKIDEFMLEFLKIYDDFERAKQAYVERDIDVKGLDSILKNMDSLLIKYNIQQIDALGEIFDPNKHEAISIISDPHLDDDTITKEIRKGYISHTRVIRPTLVEISKKKDVNSNE